MSNISNLTNLIAIRGIALAEIGRIEEGINVLKYGIEVCENFGAFLRLGVIYNSVGYCYGEIYQSDKAWPYNKRSETIARKLMKENPMGIRQFAEIAAQANVNLMENLFDQGKPEEAWKIMEALEEESKSTDFNMFRHQWESRMKYLACRILIKQGQYDHAETLVQDYLKKVQKQHLKKREGGFLRLWGDIHAIRKDYDKAIDCINEAIKILEYVGNPHQLWLAYSSLAYVYEKTERIGEANENWNMAVKFIEKNANNLTEIQPMKKQ